MNVLVQQSDDDSSTVDNFSTVSAKQPITLKHLLSHTSGISYGFDKEGQLVLLDGIYNASPILQGKGPYGLYGHSCTLQAFVDERAKQPLLFEPGSAWHYGRNHDVVGRLVELLSGGGMSLGDYLEKHIFAPLGMVDTSFTVPDNKRDRFVAMHAATSGGPGGKSK